MKTFYVQIDEKNIITDIVEFEYGDYIEIQLNTPIPHKIMSGCYKLINNEIEYIAELDEDELKNKIAILSQENADLYYKLMMNDLV